jgi:hypothetical protein
VRLDRAAAAAAAQLERESKSQRGAELAAARRAFSPPPPPRRSPSPCRRALRLPFQAPCLPDHRSISLACMVPVNLLLITTCVPEMAYPAHAWRYAEVPGCLVL